MSDFQPTLIGLRSRTFRPANRFTKRLRVLAGTASIALITAMSPASAHSYEVCATICFNAGGSVKHCAKKCNNHKHGGGSVEKLDLGFAAPGRPPYNKSMSRMRSFKLKRQRR